MANRLNGKASTQLHEDEHRAQGLTPETPDTEHRAQSLTPETPDTSTDWSDATQDLLDSLPQVWTRELLYFLVGFLCLVLPWAMLSKVDETGSAKGRLEPQGKSIRLEAPVSGTVVAIKVKEGQPVKKGQPVIELDSKEARTELQQAQARLKSLVYQSNMLEREKNNIQSKQLVQLNETHQQLNSSQTKYAIQKRGLTLAKTNMQRYKKLWRQGVIAEVKLEETEKALFEQQQLLAQIQLDIEQARSKLKIQQSDYQTQLNEHQSQIVGKRSEIAQNQSQIESLNFQLSQRELKAPESGTVFQLPIQRVGAVVQPGKMVAEIAPEGARLVLRAKMATTESGSLQQGLPVKLKFDAYPFQDYGVVSGKLASISTTTSEADTSNGKGATYDLEITLEQLCIPKADECIPLRPGQTATAEVIVRQRHLIDFILDPFKKLQKGGLEL